MSDIGNMTYGLRDNARDLIDIWVQKPLRRCEFSDREVLELEEVVLGLELLLREINKQEIAAHHSGVDGVLLNKQEIAR